MSDKSFSREDPGDVTAPDDVFFERPENAVLLQAMLRQQRFSYQQLAELTDSTVNALRKRFADQPEWRQILKVIGNVPSRAPGPKQKLFRLRPAAAEAIRTLAVPPEGEAQLTHFHPQLNNARSLLTNADRCLDRSPGISFDLYERAQQVFDYANAYLDKGEERGILQKSETIRAEIDGLQRDFRYMISKLRQASEMRLHGDEGIDKTELTAIRVSHETDGLSKYFFTMPERSIRGYGGAILAKSNGEEVHHENLNSYFAKRIGDDRDNNPFSAACAHALNEVLRLSVHESAWIRVAERIVDGVRRTTTLVGQHAVLDVLRGAREVDRLEVSLRDRIGDVLKRHDCSVEVPQPGVDDLLATLHTGQVQ